MVRVAQPSVTADKGSVARGEEETLARGCDSRGHYLVGDQCHRSRNILCGESTKAEGLTLPAQADGLIARPFKLLNPRQRAAHVWQQYAHDQHRNISREDLTMPHALFSGLLAYAGVALLIAWVCGGSWTIWARLEIMVPRADLLGQNRQKCAESATLTPSFPSGSMRPEYVRAKTNFPSASQHQ